MIFICFIARSNMYLLYIYVLLYTTRIFTSYSVTCSGCNFVQSLEAKRIARGHEIGDGTIA